MFYFLLIAVIGLGIVGIITTIIAAQKQPVNVVDKEPDKSVLRHPIRNNPVFWTYILSPIVVIAGGILFYFYFFNP